MINTELPNCTLTIDSQLTLFTRTRTHFLTQRKIEAERTTNRLDREDYF